MLTVFASNQGIMSVFGNPTIITTDPMSSRGTHAELTVNVHQMFAVGATGTPQIVVSLQGSNDGQVFQDISGLSDVIVAAGPGAPLSAAVRSAYVRLSVMAVAQAGTPGDWQYAVFDAHVNFTEA